MYIPEVPLKYKVVSNGALPSAVRPRIEIAKEQAKLQKALDKAAAKIAKEAEKARIKAEAKKERERLKLINKVAKATPKAEELPEGIQPTTEGEPFAVLRTVTLAAKDELDKGIEAIIAEINKEETCTSTSQLPQKLESSLLDSTPTK